MRDRGINRPLLARLLQASPLQPATALWRSVEVATLAREPWPVGRGLDLGCGDGLVTRIVLDLAGAGNAAVVGIDPDAAECELARRSGQYATVHTCGGDNVPELDDSFDWVLSNSVLEHVAPIDAVLGETARLLRPGGQFIFTVPGPGFHDCLRGPLAPGVRRSRYLRTLDRRLWHLRYWTPDEWRTHLSAVGLQVTSVVPFLDRGQVRRWETISRLTAGVLYALAGHQRQPIEIQRRLGRGRGRHLPAWVATSLSVALSLGMRSGDDGHGCLLIRGKLSISPG